MRVISKAFAFLSLVTALVLFTSAVPVSNIGIAGKQTEKKLTNKELLKVAAEAKGAKLSLKEKIAIKVFNKKLSQMEEQYGSTSDAGGGKSQVIALILCILVGGLGIHRFYLGYTWQGVVQLLTAGGCGIWWVIDLIRIVTGDLQPKDGSYEKTL